MLEEEIYMDQLEEFMVSNQDNKVCKLVCSLYGLKQAPKQWHERFESVIESNEFKTCDYDKCVYWKKFNDSWYVRLCLYVDGILVFSGNPNEVSETTLQKNMVFGHYKP